MTVQEAFIAFLNMSENALKICVNLYNAGRLTENGRLALEMIDGCDGPGDAIHVEATA